MKKVFILALTAATISFSSCGNNTAPKADAVDSTEIADSISAIAEEASSAADAAINELTSKLDAKDASAFQAALEAAKAKVEEFVAKNPEAAKEYLTKVQTFLTENADKIKTAIGDNAAVNTAIGALTAAPVDDIINNFSSKLTEGKEAGTEAVNDAKEKLDKAADAIKDAPEAAKDAANKAVEDAKNKANEKANEAIKGAKDKASESIDKAASDVKGKLGL